MQAPGLPASIPAKAAALAGVRDMFRYDDPDIEFDNIQNSLYDAVPAYNILTLPRTGDFYQHPMGVVVVADSLFQ
jgi:hypothetical protein